MRCALDLAYEKDSYLSGSSVLSCTLYEVQLWNFYLTYVNRSKVDKLESVGFWSAKGSCAGSFKKPIKDKDILAQPAKQKKSASDMFRKMLKLKPKGSNNG